MAAHDSLRSVVLDRSLLEKVALKDQHENFRTATVNRSFLYLSNTPEFENLNRMPDSK